MKKLGKKGDILTVDGVTVQIESADADSAVCSIADDSSRTYHLAREGDLIAGGKTKRSAQLALRKKAFYSKTDEERISDFVKQYPPDAKHTVDEWMEIHQELTGACCMGGYRFIRSKGFKRFETYSTMEFLEAVDGAYGGDIIAKVKKHYV